MVDTVLLFLLNTLLMIIVIASKLLVPHRGIRNKYYTNESACLVTINHITYVHKQKWSSCWYIQALC